MGTCRFIRKVNRINRWKTPAKGEGGDGGGGDTGVVPEADGLPVDGVDDNLHKVYFGEHYRLQFVQPPRPSGCGIAPNSLLWYTLLYVVFWRSSTPAVRSPTNLQSCFSAQSDRRRSVWGEGRWWRLQSGATTID